MIATGAVLGLKPWEVMSLRPIELAWMADGHRMASGEKPTVLGGKKPDIEEIKRRLALLNAKPDA